MAPGPFPFILLLTGALVLSSGCFGNHSTDEHAYPSSFTAVYGSANGGTFSLTLGQPEQMLDHDGRHRLAYPLTFSASTSLGRTVNWLDHDFRVIRTDSFCGDESTGSCNYVETEWASRGGFSWFGVGIPWHWFDHSSLVLHLGDKQVPLEPIVTKIGHLTQFSFDFTAPAAAIQPYPYGNYWYEPGQSVPSRVDMRSTGANVSYERQSFADGLPLAPIDASAFAVPPPLPAPRASQLFPGSGVRLFDAAATMDQALAFLREASSDANQTLSQGGCVAASGQDMPQSEQGMLPLDSATHTTFWITIADNQGAYVIYRIQHTTVNLTGQVLFKIVSEAPAPSFGTCEEQQKAPWPETSAQNFVGRAAEVPVSGRLFGFSHAANGFLLVPISPSSGWDAYRATFAPDSGGGASGVNYHVSLDANTQHWRRMMVHPDDLKQLDEP